MKIVYLLMVALLVPMVYADAIEPGQRGIGINNMITNMGDYPDYVFIQVGQLGPSMCPMQVIGSDGVIPGGYKFCDFSVFAVERSEFDSSFVVDADNKFVSLDERARMSDPSIDVERELKDYLMSKGAVEVISGIETYKTVPEESPEQDYTEYYTVDLSGVQEKPRNTEITNNYLTYLYVAIPIVALVVIVLLLLKKRR
ncbi:MAG: hypothetical protein V1645_05160 [archaeon]